MEKVAATLRGSLAVVGVSLALGIFFNILVWHYEPGFGLTLFVLLLIAGFIGLARYTQKPIRGDLRWLFPLLVLFAVLISIRASAPLLLLNMLASIGLMLLMIETTVHGSLRKFVPAQYIQAVFSPLKWLGPMVGSCADVFSFHEHLKGERRAGEITRGVLITLPVVVLFAYLFSSADPVFGRFFADVFEMQISPETIFRVILTGVVSLALIGGYSYAFTASAESSAEGARSRPLGHTEGVILFSSINALFIAFILVQITYFFGGESNIAVAGMTYAEYARRGFFELLAVATISYLILLAGETFIKRDAARQSLIFKFLASAMVLEVGVIMASSFMRLSLYEEAFGFTILRLYSHAFIIFLAVVFAILLYKILLDHRENTFAFRTFLTIAGFILFMNAFNPDAFIAQKNLDRYVSTGKIDTEYLSRLSSDAADTLIGILKMPESEEKTALARALLKKSEVETLPWQSWNLSRAEAAESLRARRAELEQYRQAEPAESISTH